MSSSSRSFAVGSYTRHVQETEDPFTSRVMGILNDDISELSPEDRLTAGQVKAAALLAQLEDQKAQDRLRTREVGDAFVAGHPEYVDSDANAALLLHEMDVMFGEGYHPLENFEAGYESLRSKTNFLKLNQSQIASQKRVADKARFDAQSAQPVTPSEEELYLMPLEEIRMRDAVENQRRMQREGETGGW